MLLKFTGFNSWFQLLYKSIIFEYEQQVLNSDVWSISIISCAVVKLCQWCVKTWSVRFKIILICNTSSIIIRNTKEEELNVCWWLYNTTELIKMRCCKSYQSLPNKNEIIPVGLWNLLPMSCVGMCYESNWLFVNFT